MENFELKAKQLIDNLKSGKVLFENLPVEVRSNKEIALVAINIDGHNFEFVSDNLKDDKEVVEAAIFYDAFAILKASDRLQEDEDLNWHAILTDLDYFADAPASIKNNKSIVKSLAEILCDKMDLEYYRNIFVHISPELKDNKDFMYYLIKDFCYPLEHTSKKMRNNRDIVNKAIKNGYKEFMHASPRLRGDKEIVLLSLNYGGDDTLIHASNAIRKDRDFILNCFKDFGCLAYKIPEMLNNDRDLVYCAVKSWGGNLRYVSKELRDEKELALIALQDNPYLYTLISKRLLKNVEVLNLVSSIM